MLKAVRPGFGRQHLHVVALQQAGHGEDLRMSSSTSNTFLPASERFGLVQLLDDLLLGGGQLLDLAVQEQGRFVEQPLRRPHVLAAVWSARSVFKRLSSCSGDAVRRRTSAPDRSARESERKQPGSFRSSGCLARSQHEHAPARRSDALAELGRHCRRSRRRRSACRRPQQVDRPPSRCGLRLGRRRARSWTVGSSDSCKRSKTRLRVFRWSRNGLEIAPTAPSFKPRRQLVFGA